MQKILEDLRGVECQMDDILVYGANQAEHDERLEVVITRLSSAPGCAIFDPALETTLSADASSYGLGAVMTQKQKDGNWKPVAFISQAPTATEMRCTQIEKEALTTVHRLVRDWQITLSESSST